MRDHKLLKHRLLDKWSQCFLCKLFLKICYSPAGKITSINSAFGELLFPHYRTSKLFKFGIPLHFVPQKCMIRNCLFPEVLSGEIKSIKMKIKCRLSKSRKRLISELVQKSNLVVVKPKWETEPDDHSITISHHKNLTHL